MMMMVFIQPKQQQQEKQKRSKMSAFNQLVQLNNGLSMPVVGLGTWKSTNEGEVKASVISAVTAGYRHIDCAWCYRNQNEVGEAITEILGSGLVKREDLWVTSKLWNNFHAPSDVEAHCRETLEQLKLDYLDLYLIHWPVTDSEGEELTPSYKDTWLAMEELLAKGLVKTIGVSNLSAKKISAMKDYATIFPAVNQVELHPLFRQNDLLAVCSSLGTHVTAYSPLGSPDSAEMIKHAGASVLSHPTVGEIAARLGKSPAQVLIRWAVQRGTSVVPKSSNPGRIQENFDVFSWELSPEDFAALSTIEPQSRMIHGGFWLKPETGPYRTLADLWDE